jgi:hypothetical protein
MARVVLIAVLAACVAVALSKVSKRVVLPEDPFKGLPESTTRVCFKRRRRVAHFPIVPYNDSTFNATNAALKVRAEVQGLFDLSSRELRSRGGYDFVKAAPCPCCFLAAVRAFEDLFPTIGWDLEQRFHHELEIDDDGLIGALTYYFDLKLTDNFRQVCSDSSLLLSSSHLFSFLFFPPPFSTPHVLCAAVMCLSFRLPESFVLSTCHPRGSTVTPLCWRSFERECEVPGG